MSRNLKGAWTLHGIFKVALNNRYVMDVAVAQTLQMGRNTWSYDAMLVLFQGGTAVVVSYCYLFLLSVFILWFSFYVSDILCKF